MKLRVVLFFGLLTLALLGSAGTARAECWKCAATEEGPQCQALPWWSTNYFLYYTICSQNYRCFGGTCISSCRAYGSQCTYFDIYY